MAAEGSRITPRYDEDVCVLAATADCLLRDLETKMLKAGKQSSVAVLLLALGLVLSASGNIDAPGSAEPAARLRIESFSFQSNGTTRKAKIYLPATYGVDKDLPAIYLVDFAEQHFKIATDEFEMVINGVRQIEGFEALVVSLEGIPDIDAEPDAFSDHLQIFKDMASYVDGLYTNNPSRTFIGKGSESGIVMMALFREDPESSVFDHFIASDPSGHYARAIIEMLETESFPANKTEKKLHFSYSTSNDPVTCDRIIELIDDAQYPWLEFHSVAYTDSDYETTYPVAFADGLGYLFSQKNNDREKQ